MKCNVEWLSAYLDGLLSEDKRAKLEEHLKTCEACAAKLEEFARVEQIAKKIPALQLSEAYWENFASRVQNKLAIRERQKTSPAWLEALKSFFQPTTGKLAIAGSLATLLFVAIIGQDYWKKEAYQPPKFEAVAPPANDKTDYVQEPAKDESAFRAVRPDEKNVVAEKKRGNEIAPAKVANEGIIESRETAPAALAPAEIASKPAGRQKSKEVPSLAASVERDEGVKGDTLLATAGKKAEVRKEIATSQVKVSAEEIEKLPIRNVTDALKLRAQTPSPNESTVQKVRAVDTIGKKNEAVLQSQRKITREEIESLPIRSSNGIDNPDPPKSTIDTFKLIFKFRQIIPKKEKELGESISQSKKESLYIALAYYYRELYRLSQNPKDWNNANKRTNEFLKNDISESTRKILIDNQTVLRIIKK